MPRPRLALLALIVVLGVACSPPTAEELVRERMAVRNDFDVELSSWVDRDDPSTDGKTIYLDLRVVKNTEEPLDALTVMTEQLDAQGNVLEQQRITLDVSGMTRGLAKSIGADLAPMHPEVDGIRVGVEPEPPREAWDQFPEFDDVRPRG